MLQKWINRATAYCTHHAWLIIGPAIILAALSAFYVARHFAIDTDINDLLSAELPWRQQEVAFQKAFPQTVELILVDVGAPTPEAAEAAARDVEQALANKPNLFRSVRGELDNPFFRRNGLLFLSVNQIGHFTGQLITSRPMLSGLVRDPSLRGLVQTLVGILNYQKQGYWLARSIRPPPRSKALPKDVPTSSLGKVWCRASRGRRDLCIA